MVSGGLKRNKKAATATAGRIRPVGFFGSNATCAADHRRPVQRSHVEARTGVKVSAPIEQQGGDVCPPLCSSEVRGCPVRWSLPSTGASPASRTRTASAFPVTAACVNSDGAIVALSARIEWPLGEESTARKKNGPTFKRVHTTVMSSLAYNSPRHPQSNTL
jgi:hypothetical protein